MPRAFDITPSTTRIRASSGETGEIAFTVSNKLEGLVHARAVAAPDGETDGTWLSIPAGQEYDLGKDETKLITVKYEIPANAKAGTYPFHIVVSSLSNPDELYAVSSTVPIEVKHVERKFPWWIVILAGGLLVVGGGAFGLMKVMGNKPAPPGNDCISDANCPGTQRCVEIRPGARSCLLKPEQACTGDIQCASAFCRDDGTCARDDGKCTPQTAQQDCRPGAFTCAGGKCLLVDGQPCLDHAECATDFCSGTRTCTPCSVQCPFPLRCHRNQCVPRTFTINPKVLQEFRRFQGIQGLQR